MTAASGDELRVALIQMRSAIEDRERNIAKAGAMIDEAAANGAELIVLPEFFNWEYFAQYRDTRYLGYAEREDGPTLTAIREKAVEHSVAICATILEEAGPGFTFDTAFLVGDDGRILTRYRKTHPGGSMSLEKLYFRGGASFPVASVKGIRVGMIICYDHFFPETARCAAINGAELVLGPFAAPGDALPLWESIMRTRAFENGVFLAPTNKVGQEGDWVFGGASMVVSPYGEVLVRASTTDEETVYAGIDRQQVYAARRRFPMFRDRRPDVYAPLVAVDGVGAAQA